MAYSTQTDLENRIGVANLAQLTNDTAGTTTPSAAIVATLIQRADALINTKCKNIYDIPLTEVIDGTVSSASTTLTGTGTAFTDLSVGDPLLNLATGEIRIIASIAFDTSATTVTAFTTLASATLYRIPQIIFTTSVDLACYYAMQRRFSEMELPEGWREIGRKIFGTPQMKGLLDQIGSLEMSIGLAVANTQSAIVVPAANSNKYFELPSEY